MKKDIHDISRQIAEYGSGCFDRRLRTSGKDEEVDAIKEGINMLGEELREMMISRDFFNSIFHAVSDMVFLLDRRGIMVDFNQSVTEQLLLTATTLSGRSINMFSSVSGPPLYTMIRELLKHPYSPTGVECSFYSPSGRIIQVLMTARYLRQGGLRSPKRILVTARDITGKQAAENALLRAVIDTQEKERSRLARDLHDSLGQQLSAIRFFLASTEKETVEAKRSKLIARSKNALVNIMEEMRNICFNLMPMTLEEFGLYEAIRESCSNVRLPPGVRCQVSPAGGWPRLERKLEIDLYRIVQEFVGNAIRHGNARHIQVKMKNTDKNLLLFLKDDGCGFDPSTMVPGMGLKNMSTRVRSYLGKLELDTAPGRGVKCRISLPSLNANSK